MKTKNTKKSNEYKNFGALIIAMAIVIFGLMVSLIGVILCKNDKMRTPTEETYLSLYPHLMHDYAHDCAQLNNFGNAMNPDGTVIMGEDGLPARSKTEWQCRMTGYGVNENGEPYVDFEAWNLDLITDEFISDREEYTITFKCTTDDYCPRWTTKK